MKNLDLTLPDSHFTSQRLMTEWDKLTFAHVADTELRKALNQLKEMALNRLSDSILRQDQDVSRRLITGVEEALYSTILDRYYEENLIQPHLQNLCDTTIRLYLESYHADSTEGHRRQHKELKDAWGGTPSPSGLVTRHYPRQSS